MRFTAVLQLRDKIRRIDIEAENNREARSIISELFPSGNMETKTYCATTDGNGKPNIEGIIVGAWGACKRVARMTTEREGTEQQWELLFDIERRRTDGTSGDCHQEAIAAILEAISEGLPIEDQYHRAYAAVQRWLYENGLYNRKYRGGKPVELDALVSGIDIVKIAPYVGTVIKEESGFVPMIEDDAPERNAQYVATVLRTLAELTEAQAEAVYMIVSRGLSLRKAAAEAGITHAALAKRLGYAERKAEANKQRYADQRATRQEIKELFDGLGYYALEVAADVFLTTP